eukprot:Clim_evm17s169 gene=Clim_evmTU17s169
MTMPEPPQYLLCPLTMALMDCPVTAQDGYTYEDRAIRQWLSHSATSPITRQRMDAGSLLPNRVVRDLTEDWCKKHGIQGVEPAPTGPAINFLTLSEIQLSEQLQSRREAGLRLPGEYWAALKQRGQQQQRIHLSVNQILAPAVMTSVTDCNGVFESSHGGGNSDVHSPTLPHTVLRLETVTEGHPTETDFGPSTADVVDGQRRAPIDVICVLDISSSMDRSAAMAGAELNVSFLDLVRHAAKTVAHLLGPDDRLGLITFGSHATVAMDPVPMDGAGKERADAVVEAIRTAGATNLWAGLRLGLDLVAELRTVDAKDAAKYGLASTRPAFVLLLTDGEPNQRPASGTEDVAMLRHMRKRGLDTQGGVSVHTLAFGFDAIDTELLSAIALKGQGSYAYIPDSGFVGTIFAHAVANMLTTAVVNTRVCFEFERDPSALGIGSDGASQFTSSAVEDPVKAVGPWPDSHLDSCNTDTFWLSVSLGALHHGQARECVLPLWNPCLRLRSVRVEYRSVGGSMAFDGGDVEVVNVDLRNREYDDDFQLLHPAEALTAVVRATFAEALVRIGSVRTGGNNAAKSAASVMDRLRGPFFGSATDFPWPAESGGEPPLSHTARQALVKRLQGLGIDFNGEITAAVSSEQNFNRWGRHYFQSLGHAHRIQERNNFKDAGVAVYGGALFKRLVELGSDTFDDLEPPSIRGSPYFNRGGRSMQINPTSYASLNLESNPCVSGDTMIAVRAVNKGGSANLTPLLKRADDLRSGDVLANGAVVDWVLRTVFPQPTLQSMTALYMDTDRQREEILITPWHPIRRSRHDNELDGDAMVTDDEEDSNRSVIKRHVFPCEAVPAQATQDRWVTSLVSIVTRRNSATGRRPGVPIGSQSVVEMVSLGHGIPASEDPVAAHQYLGTDRIVGDLRLISAALLRNVREISVGPNALVRSTETGLVVGIRPDFVLVPPPTMVAVRGQGQPPTLQHSPWQRQQTPCGV